MSSLLHTQRAGRILFCLAAVSLHPGLAQAGEVSVKDDVGRAVTLASPARRIVTLSPHLTELLFELGIGDRIVGTVRYSDYPAEARSIQRLGDAFSLNIEMLLEMEPDLVLAWYSGGATRAVDKILSMGVPVYFNEAETLQSISDSAIRIGRLSGIEERATERGHAYLARLASIRNRYADLARVRVFYQMSEVNLYTVNRQHLIGQALELCGADNVFAETPIKVFQVSREAVVNARPQLILFTGSDEERKAGRWRDAWKTFEQIPAVATGQLRALSPDIITRPSFRMAEGIEALCRVIDDARNPS